jgi:hypothetical protein
MLVRFSTRHGQLTMFGDAATALLKLLGHSATIPGAILAADLPAALASLRSGLDRHGDTPVPEPGAETAPTRDEDTRPPPITLRTRAVPLIDLIETAIVRGADLMWERS